MYRKSANLVFIFFALLFILMSHFLFPRFITETKNPLLNLLRPPQKMAPIKQAKDLEIKLSDGNLMTASLVKSEVKVPNGLIILIHGIRGQKESFNGLTRRLAKRGFHSVAVDLRGHGHNSASHCTFGAKEKHDISLLVDHLIHKEGIDQKIGLWGISLGGAVSLQALAADKRISFAIIESTFSNFNGTVHNYFEYFGGFNIPLFTNYLIKRAGKMADFEPSKVITSEACKNITQDILVVHGDKDKRIPLKNARANFENLKSPNKELLIIEGADHDGIWEVGGEEYFERALVFLEGVVMMG